MIEMYHEFSYWISENKNYSSPVIKDIISRLKRADKILNFSHDSNYLKELSQNSEFNQLGSSIKSQIKKSVKLYNEFIEDKKIYKKSQSLLKVGSLFANIGVAEARLHEIGVDVVVANELEPRRAKLYKEIYPLTSMICGDINELSIQQRFIDECKRNEIDVLMATPPCQGMSTAGKQLDDDERNQLIIPVIDIISNLKPNFAFIENVPMLLNTKINMHDKEDLIISHIKNYLEQDYNISITTINTEDYSVPQSRERVIILLSKKTKNIFWNIPEKNKKKVTMEDAIGDIPELDPVIKDITREELLSIFPEFEYRRKRAEQISKWHRPPHHIKRQVIAMMHTPTGQTAFDNEHYYPKKADGSPVRGYRNTYKRQNWDRPAYTVTMDNRKISSQNNVHPGRFNKETRLYSDARVLTLYEIMKIMSLPEDWNLPDSAPEAFVRRIIGEGIPPLFVKKVFAELLKEIKNEC